MMFKSKMIVSIFAVVLLIIYGIQGTSYGDPDDLEIEADCEVVEHLVGDLFRVRIWGTVTARKDLKFLRITGYVDGEWLGVDIVGDLSAGSSEDFSITGLYTHDGGAAPGCSVDYDYRVSDTPPPVEESDLVVEQPTVSKSTLDPGERFTLSTAVRNQGEGRSDSTTLRYYRSTDTRISTSDTEVGTDSVSALSANRSSDESITLSAPTSPGTYYYGACVESVSDESRTNNNCSAAVRITVEQLKSDLVVDRPTVSKSTLAPGENFTLSATVRNQGAGSTAATTLRYYRSTDSTITTSDTEVGTDSVSSLDANGSGTESISLTAPTSPGTYYYGACVEAVSDESNSNNNCSAAVRITVQQLASDQDDDQSPDDTWSGETTTSGDDAVDVEITVVGAEHVQGNRFNITIEGTARANVSEVEGLRIEGRVGGDRVGSESLGTLSRGNSENFSITGSIFTEKNNVTCELKWSATDTTNKRCRTVTRPIIFGGVVIGSATNTTCSGGESVQGAVSTSLHLVRKKSDLAVQQPTVNKSTLAPGENFTLSATVRNQGAGSTAATTLRYYRSTDTTISTGDTEVGTDSVSALDANGSSAQSITLTAPTSPGTYYYGACVEAVSDESLTNNNCSAAVSITVNQPELSSSTPSPLTEPVLDGSEVTLTMTDATYDQSLSTISNAITVSGIVGVTVGTVRRVNDTEVTVTLAFDGTDFDTDATLTFSVGADAIANYDGSALTAQVPVTAIKGFDFDFSVPAGVSMIHVPLKVTKVDGVAKTIESISDLYAALGGADAVIFLMTYDSEEGWLGYWGTSDTGTAADRTLTDDMGIYARLIVPVSVQLTGDALGTIGSGTITLNQGLNLVGLPLRDSRITRVSDLFTLDGIRGNVFGISLADDGAFKTVGQAGDPGDIPVTGGQSFILTAQRSATVTISGEAWTNVSETAAAPSLSLKGIEVGDVTPVLALRGAIVDEHTGLNELGFRVTVKNLSTGRTVTGMTKAEGGAYKLTVVDIEMGQAAAIGDVLEISAQSPNPLIGVEPLRYTLTAEDVKRSLIQLPELVAYEIPAETQLLSNYPNPFNPETWIPYRLAEDAFVTLTIYDSSGQVVRTIDVGYQTAAVYESRSKAIYWDGGNEFGETVASGVYFYHLSAGDYSATRKMVILK